MYGPADQILSHSAPQCKPAIWRNTIAGGDLANYKQTHRLLNKQVKKLTLSFGLAFEDLYAHEGLAKIDSIFLKQLEEAAPALP